MSYETSIFYKRASKSFVLACGHSGEIGSWDSERMAQYEWFRSVLLDGLNNGELYIDEIPSGIREGFCCLMISAEAFGQYQHRRMDKLLDFLDAPDIHNHIVIFGCGNHGSSAYRLLKSKGYVIEAFMDNNQTLWGSEIDGVRIVPPETTAEYGDETRYIIANELYADDIERQIKELTQNKDARIYKYTPEIG